MNGAATASVQSSSGGAANGASSSSSSSANDAAAKRARRRQAQKANKKALHAADQAQKEKFAHIKQEEDGPDGGDEKKIKQQDGDQEMHDNEQTAGASTTANSSSSAFAPPTKVKSESDIELIVEAPTIDLSNPAMAELAGVFERFQKLGEAQRSSEEEMDDGTREQTKEERIDAELRAQMTDATSTDGETLSRRKQKERDRLAIEDLKQLVSKPDVVELHDANAADPKLLVYLKSYRNTVPVPMHWSKKGKYLQNKKGFEKPPFQLPACIEQTGISKMRGAQQEKEKDATNKQKQRAKMTPKMGKIDIDYQILHDAFFRFQTKPVMTQHGELYYEGREHEIKMTEKKPGQLSPALREALGLKSDLAPPPWLYNMQRFGPPPAYPHLAIPGVSAPIPTGAKYGFGENEWGKPPVDAHGRPLYGDVFGVEKRSIHEIEHIDRTRWGVIQAEDDEEEEQEEEEQMDEQKEEDTNELDQSAMNDGTQSTVSTMSGLTTPEVLSLRKADGTGTETPDTVAQRPKSLYTVLEEKRTNVGGGLFGTSHTYTIPNANSTSMDAQNTPTLTEQEKRVAAAQARNRGQVDVELNPDQLGSLDAASLKRIYDARLQQQQEASKKRLAPDEDDDEDGGDQKKKKRKKGGGGSDKGAYKDFKF